MSNLIERPKKHSLWRLSPAFDVVYSYNPTGDWTSQHQMSLNGKRDDFDREDLIALAKMAGLKTPKALQLLADVEVAVGGWRRCAKRAGVLEPDIERIATAHRLGL